MKDPEVTQLIRMCLLPFLFAAAVSWADDATSPASPSSSLADALVGMDSDTEALDDALWSAAADGDLERFDSLLARGAGAGSRGVAVLESAMWIAAQEGHCEIVRRLLALGASVDATGPSDNRTALFQAAQEGHEDIVDLLLVSGARVDVASARTGATPLFIAAARGHLDVVRLLLAANANIHIEARANGIQDSPLSIARKRGYVRIAETIEGVAGTKIRL